MQSYPKRAQSCEGPNNVQSAAWQAYSRSLSVLYLFLRRSASHCHPCICRLGILFVEWRRVSLFQYPNVQLHCLPRLTAKFASKPRLETSLCRSVLELLGLFELYAKKPNFLCQLEPQLQHYVASSLEIHERIYKISIKHLESKTEIYFSTRILRWFLEWNILSRILDNNILISFKEQQRRWKGRANFRSIWFTNITLFHFYDRLGHKYHKRIDIIFLFFTEFPRAFMHACECSDIRSGSISRVRLYRNWQKRSSSKEREKLSWNPENADIEFNMAVASGSVETRACTPTRERIQYIQAVFTVWCSSFLYRD